VPINRPDDFIRIAHLMPCCSSYLDLKKLIKLAA
jgi:hypothetical protein